MLVLLDVCVVVSTVVVVVIGFVGNTLDELDIVVGELIIGVVPDGFGTNESTTPIGPSKSTSESGHDSSSG